jgi:hypothetical protein
LRSMMRRRASAPGASSHDLLHAALPRVVGSSENSRAREAEDAPMTLEKSWMRPCDGVQAFFPRGRLRRASAMDWRVMSSHTLRSPAQVRWG